jgi:hypothetical protein
MYNPNMAKKIQIIFLLEIWRFFTRKIGLLSQNSPLYFLFFCEISHQNKIMLLGSKEMKEKHCRSVQRSALEDPHWWSVCDPGYQEGMKKN